MFPSGKLSGIQNIYVRGIWPVNTTLYGLSSAAGDLIPLRMINPVSNYLDINIAGPFPVLYGLRLEASTKDGVMRGFCYAGVGDCNSMTVTDVAVQTAQCYDDLSVDLGTVSSLNYFTAKFSNFVDGSVLTSVDGYNYSPRLSLAPYSSSANVIQISLPRNTAGRYVKFRYFKIMCVLVFGIIIVIIIVFLYSEISC